MHQEHSFIVLAHCGLYGSYINPLYIYSELSQFLGCSCSYQNLPFWIFRKLVELFKKLVVFGDKCAALKTMK